MAVAESWEKNEKNEKREKGKKVSWLEVDIPLQTPAVVHFQGPVRI